ncbi:MAG: hypothetical protein QF903_07100 [Planctomycetota bacterium]|jgi:hypothetical protein|nr:hypothetical protein [Planctomycetota bacterium]MDP6763743.1 hypothetical protein [Planctomycetota bacterium]MDP6989231.1 hypothetical protein [Planctomycetota bacterium]
MTALTTRNGTGRHRRWTSLFLGGLLVGLGSMAVGNGGYDDEMVGTMPMSAGFIIGEPGQDFQRDTAFYLYGPTSRVVRGIVGSAGNGAITVQDAGGKNSLVLFHQTLAAELDATLFLDPEVEAGLATGPGLGPVAVGLGTDERIVGVSALAPLSRRALPIGAYYENGHLSQGVHLFTRTAAGERSHVVLDAIGGVVSLRQVTD